MKTTTTSPRGRLAALVAALAVVVLGAFGAAAPAAAAAPSANGMATAWVRAAHLVPGLGSMQISLVPFAGAAAGEVTKPGVPAASEQDGARVVEAASTYGSAGEYRQIPQGLYTVMVRPTGASPDSEPVLTGTLDAKANQAYTLAALGSKTDPRIQALADDLRRPKAGTASVRLLAAATDAPRVTVTAQGGPTVAEDAAFGEPTGYAAVPAGPWTLDVATSTTSGGRSVRGENATGTVDLASGAVYTLLVLDGQDGLQVKPLVDAEGVAEAPQGGVQTGGGGMAARPADHGVVGGLALAGSGALALAGLGLLRRRQVLATGRR